MSPRCTNQVNPNRIVDAVESLQIDVTAEDIATESKLVGDDRAVIESHDEIAIKTEYIIFVMEMHKAIEYPEIYFVVGQ